MTSHLLLVAGMGVLSFALRSFQFPLLHRMGTAGIFLTSFLAGWLLGGALWIGVVFAAFWLLLPWLEILTHVRRLRLPIERALQSRTPPPRNTFPGFTEFSDEAEQLGFEYAEDAGWTYNDHAHFFRLFYHAEKRIQAAICLVEQGDLAFYYLSLTTRGVDERVFVTWNYPFSYGLQLPPKIRLNRLQGEVSFEQLLERHESFLTAQKLPLEMIAEQPAGSFRRKIQGDLHDQIIHNLNRGLLVRDGEKLIRYTLRGMFFLWLQFLRDLVRFS
ncbi:MAG TPA: hypothetical protein VIS74_01415 [Chthoniobacterales bacterium]